VTLRPEIVTQIHQEIKKMLEHAIHVNFNKNISIKNLEPRIAML
jgi:hypothetical protein